MKEWSAFVEKHYPEGDRTSLTVYGYALAPTLVQVLKQANNLTHENVRQATSLKDFTVGTLLPASASRPGPPTSSRSSRCR